MEILTKVKKASWSYAGLYLQKREPVIVLAPGRVASMAVTKCLDEAGEFVFKVATDSETRGKSQFAYKHIISAEHPAKLVTLIRDPMAQSVSAFFSKANRGKYIEVAEAFKEGDTETIIESFMTRYINSDKYKYYINWFDTAFKQFTGVNIYDHPFNTELKFGTVDDNRYPTLILRIDIDNATKTQALRSFIGNKKIQMEYSNTRADKGNQDLYEQFKKDLALPLSVLDQTYNSTYAQHFFTTEELARFRRQWGERST